MLVPVAVRANISLRTWERTKDLMELQPRLVFSPRSLIDPESQPYLVLDRSLATAWVEAVPPESGPASSGTGPLPEAGSLFWLTVAGVSYSFSIIWYLKALSVDEVSRINIWWNIIPLFSLVAGGLVLHEWPNFRQYLAMSFLLVGSIVASVQWKKNQKIISPGLGWIILGWLEFSFYGIVIRLVSATTPVWFIFVYINCIRLIKLYRVRCI